MIVILSNIFKAYSITNEIDLNKIATGCNIPKKYTWEEPLILYGNVLSSIIGQEVDETQKVMIFAFGSIVFMNISQHSIDKLLSYVKSVQPNVDLKDLNKYADDYELKTACNSDQTEIELTDRYAIIQKCEPFYPELISTVIAKSVALEKSEEQVSQILDKVETIIERFEKGKLSIGYKELVGTISKVVRHEYNTIAYIMILDKPDITWSNGLAAEFYDKMCEFFELNDRYDILKKKADVLNNMMSGFSSISHTSRSLFLEWLIVILILVEIIIMLLQMI